MKDVNIVVLGAAGFVGRETVRQAVREGARVTAVMRSERTAIAGARTIIADASNTSAWIDAAKGADAVIDLIQPALPRRVTRRALIEMSRYRTSLAQQVARAIEALPTSARPIYVSVSGLAEVQPDARGYISHRSSIDRMPRGFGVIGAGVERALSSIAIHTAFAHLGTVYGPGKVFAERMVPGLRAGKFPVVGSGRNHVGLVHVSDAARALLHIARLGSKATETRWIITQNEDLTLGQFIDGTAEALHADKPRRIPRWLGSLVLGSGVADELTKDKRTDPSALFESGWTPTFATTALGVAATLNDLGDVRA